MAAADQRVGGSAEKQATPSISLPKGGGAVRGIGEKFSANPVTGTGTMSVPIATSPGRSGFGPQLSLTYDSGTGNGPFGFGWSLPVPSITRKTDKGLPQYRDIEESDVFILSGAEDLVPCLAPDGTHDVDDTSIPGYSVHRYRPRIEGAFVRIERWTRHSDGDIHWRTFSSDNILSVYGQGTESRIVDPEDRLRVFTWLLCETRDDRGNVVLYEFKRENGSSVDLTQACERNRGDRDDPRRGANRYLKRIRYGNQKPLLNASGRRPRFLLDLPLPQLQNAGWMFEVIFDYGEHDANRPQPDDAGEWTYRQDPFSSYRAGFEVRTTRICRRVLMFHHIPDLASGERGYEGLVRSTDFTYSHEQNPTSARNPVYTFLRAVTQSGYRRKANGYEQRSLPPVEFDYTQPVVQDTVEDIDPASLEHLPVGLDGVRYQWIDLHGEGIPGLLTEQADAWFYKRNWSPLDGERVQFAPLERVALKPNCALAGTQTRFMDLAGDGLADLVVVNGPTPGLYEHGSDESWQCFRPFNSRLNRDLDDPQLKWIDLDGDGHADLLLSENDEFIWYPSLAEVGFGPARRVRQMRDEEQGPRLVFADGTQSIYLADFSGDGLTDLVRIRNGEVCYWPNLGYGRFGAKVTMDCAPWFDCVDQFDPERIRLADIDGTGTTDIIYLHAEGVRIYFNQSGNHWSDSQRLNLFPRVDDLVSIVPVDLLGNGTACLVWSSPLPADARRPMRYVNLMGPHKPHLLIRTANNLGAETVVRYAPSTKFYLQDKRDGKPWITRLPFPVHVVERVEIFDRISRNHFVTRYAYHHGYFDGEQREFRGFGMVEQWDTAEFASLISSSVLPAADAENVHLASHLPPVLTKTWFHTGVYRERDQVSNYFAGSLETQNDGEYYREPGLSDSQAYDLLLPDTVLPIGLPPEEEREACRALKGSLLRQEVYSLDSSPLQIHPYLVIEQNFSVRLEQPRGANRHAVFFAHPSEAITYHYERNAADPRIQHMLTLEVDRFGNVLKQASIGYGRRQPDSALPLPVDRDKQTKTLITYTENQVTNSINDRNIFPEDYRTPRPCETRTYELTGYTPTGSAGRFQNADLVQTVDSAPTLIFDLEIAYEDQPTDGRQRRQIEQTRILYRKDDLTSLLPLGQVEPLTLVGESYKLAFTPGLLMQVFEHQGQPLLTDFAEVLGGQGGYLASQQLKSDGRFPASDPDDCWWIPSGRMFLSPGSDDTPAQEREYAQNHFFLPHRIRDPFYTSATSTESFILYDAYDLLLAETRDALGNRVTVGERRPDNTIEPSKAGNDYRVLRPSLVMDPNRNRVQVVYDVLGMLVGTAVMGKPEENEGDSLDAFSADLSDPIVLDYLNDPIANSSTLLGQATTRLVYDLFAYQRTKDQSEPHPVAVSTLARETHHADLQLGQEFKIQHSFSYSDGFGREIQKKLQAEPGPLVAGGAGVNPRWVGSGWKVFNNKGKPVRQYEPFFSATHRFEFGVEVGVSPILFYDPLERVVVTLYPNHTYEKMVFDPWRQIVWDVNDTVLADPRVDADTWDYTARYFASIPARPAAPPWQTWHTQRQGGAIESQEQAAASKAALHADTPTTTYLDTLGRPFLTLADNGPKPAQPDEHLLLATRVELDIEGNERAVRDAVEQAGDPQGRIVMRYAYDMLGKRIHQFSMEAGPRWTMHDVTGKPIRDWDGRGYQFRTTYDLLRRPAESYVREGNSGLEQLVERTVYGETQQNPESHNLRRNPIQIFDQAGVVTNDQYDFKGNLLRSRRQLAQAYKTTLDWSATAAPTLEPSHYLSRTGYDALDRPIEQETPDGSLLRPSYNEANLLERLEVNLRAAQQNGEPIWTPFITGVDYNAQGRRTRIDYGNGVSTHYAYDPLTTRLTHVLTRRNPAAFPGDCPQPAPAGWPGCQLQNLHYTYDPAGHITHLRDDAQQTIFFRNKRVEPATDYTYDAIYQLIEATGREHLGQNGVPRPHSSSDESIAWSANDGHAMGTYVERYVYDAAGNLVEMQHRGSDPFHAGWTRTYTYNEMSAIENGAGGVSHKTSNRLTSTAVGLNQPSESFLYDPHGNMLRLSHLGNLHPTPNLHWDYHNQLRQVDLDNGGTVYYVYDASGRRIRKVWEKSPDWVEDRIYLDGFEIYRRRRVGERLERETLHVMDDKQRIALVETRTIDTAGSDRAPQQLIRYQFGNHLQSAQLELDDQAQIISYEEYSPYGSTAYQAVRSQTEASKRYRYTGQEHDQEHGLYYHGARYYAPWLGRWLSCDPSGIVDGTNCYQYVGGDPINFSDPTGLEKKKGLDATGILNELVIWSQSLGGEYKGTSPDSTRLHAILNDKLPGAVKNSPQLMTEVIIDQQGKIVSFGRGPQVPGGHPKGTFQTIDALVIKDNVPLDEVEKIRSGQISAKGKVMPVDLKLGGAAMSKTAAKGIENRLGAVPLLIGQHGRFFTTRKVLRRILDEVEDVALPWLKRAAKLGKVVKPVGIAMDVVEFANNPTVETGTSIAVGAGGAYAGGKAGALLGSPLGPVGSFVGGLVGAVFGGIAGSEAGRELGKGIKFFFKTAEQSPGSLIAPGVGSFSMKPLRSLHRFPGQK